jgi:beta-N-acetylhexosaminidase|tara:strand:+ start:7311 stop:10241 length:2931 start_codon:yes stop_codon:yes gene_type:complete
MKYFYSLILILVCILKTNSQQPDPLITSDYLLQKKWVDSIYNSISLKEKIGQLFIPMVFSNGDSVHLKKTLDLVKKYKIGGLIFSKGNSKSQIEWSNVFQTEAKIPLLISMDAEWGVAMRLDDVLPFPWNMTLGAVNDNDLIYDIGKRIGEQSLRLGINMNFAPVLDVNTNPKNSIIGNRSFGESVEIVSKKSIAIMKGMHSANILTSGKHFPGHGETSKDSHKTLPTIKSNKKHIYEIELAPFKKLIEEGVSSIMIGHLNIPSLQDSDLPSSLSKHIVTNLLKNELGFNGLIFTDALNMQGVLGSKIIGNIDLAAFNAGNDIILISENIPEGISAIEKAYLSGLISELRLEHSVKKILKSKYKSNLNKYTPVKLLDNPLSSANDTLLVSKVFQRAITVLENKNQILPLKINNKYGYLSLGKGSGLHFNNKLKAYAHVDDVVGYDYKNIINQAKINKWDAIIIGWHPNKVDNNPFLNTKFSSKEIQLIRKVSSKIPVIVNVFANPYSVYEIEKLNNIKSIIISYQNNEIAQKVTVDSMFGVNEIDGKTPVRAGKKYPLGSGIKILSKQFLGYSEPSLEGFDASKLNAIDQLAKTAIDSFMTPGIQMLIARHGKIVYQKNFGYHTYDKLTKVTDSSIYDVASLTKILATLPLVMRDVSIGKINLDTKIGELLPKWKDSNKQNISLKEILSHNGRLQPWIPFYKETLTNDGKPKKRFYNTEYSRSHKLKVTENLYLKNRFEKQILKKIKQSELIDTLKLKSYKRKDNYSDLTYYILKQYLEAAHNTRLDFLVEDKIYSQLGLYFTTYNPKNKYSKDIIVPSEVDSYYRHTTLQGDVHDMGAAMLGGIGGHAGIFSNAYEVAIIMQMYLQKGFYNNKKLFSKSTFDLFNSCYYCEYGNRHGVGFDKPQIEGVGSTCGCISKESFGHSGFTGTYAWADPEKEIVFVFLSNRTFPTMENKLLVSHNIRTRIQGLLYDALEN